MKHSNWILGIGVIVAIILIAGSLYFGTESTKSADIKAVDSAAAISIKPAANYIFISIKEVSQGLFTIID